MIHETVSCTQGEMVQFSSHPSHFECLGAAHLIPEIRSRYPYPTLANNQIASNKFSVALACFRTFFAHCGRFGRTPRLMCNWIPTNAYHTRTYTCMHVHVLLQTHAQMHEHLQMQAYGPTIPLYVSASTRTQMSGCPCAAGYVCVRHLPQHSRQESNRTNLVPPLRVR